MSQPAGEFPVHVERIEGFEFRIRFDRPQYPELRADEPPPLGRDAAPNAARLLAAAVGNCLAASLLFCLRKSGAEPEALSADVQVHLVRNEAHRLRIGRLDVTLHPTLAGNRAALDACLGSFEDFCVVTQSVREGLEVNVSVEPEGSPT